MYLLFKKSFSSVQLLSRVRFSATPWITAHQASLSTNSRSSLRLTSIESVMPSSHLILFRPLLLLPPIPPSIRVFSNESTRCMRWSIKFKQSNLNWPPCINLVWSTTRLSNWAQHHCWSVYPILLIPLLEL